MKICFITTIPLTLETFVLKTAEYIHENTDWDISFICSNDEDFGNRLPEYIHYHPIHMERGISIAGIRAMLEMRDVFKKEQFDLIQYSTPNASLYAALAGKIAKVPVRLYCQWGMVFVGFQGIKRKLFKIEEKLVCRLSTWVEPDSKSNLEFSHKEKLYPSDKGSVIWNGSACGINLKKFDVLKKEEYREKIRHDLEIPKDAFVYGFVGRITRDKGINELFAAFKSIEKEREDVRLLMVGPNESDETIDAQLYQWAVDSDKVIFAGYTKVVEQYLSAMDCYILPSYREGFGMGVVEAEAMGVPVIVTDIPGPIDAMLKDETGIVVKKADAEDLLRAMKECLQEPEKMRKFGNKGIDFSRTHFEQRQLFGRILEDRKRLLNDTE